MKMDKEMLFNFECDADCCFAEWLWDLGNLTDIPPEEDELGSLAGRKVCVATKCLLDKETSTSTDEQGYMGGVPCDCPIYQSEIEMPE